MLIITVIIIIGDGECEEEEEVLGVENQVVAETMGCGS
jgi:hypothetical protein